MIDAEMWDPDPPPYTKDSGLWGCLRPFIYIVIIFLCLFVVSILVSV